MNSSGVRFLASARSASNSDLRDSWKADRAAQLQPRNAALMVSTVAGARACGNDARFLLHKAV